ncbi:MAG: hypothetical protein AAF770_02185 [Bacteroidota bacterium]
MKSQLLLKLAIFLIGVQSLPAHIYGYSDHNTSKKVVQRNNQLVAPPFFHKSSDLY